jgi:phage baseplate assembly protein V
MDATALTSFVNRLIAPLARRVAMTVSRGVVRIVYDAFKMQCVQVELVTDELQDNIEHFQEYGYTSHSLAGAEALFVSVGGNRGHGIIACITDRRYRPRDLGEGDVCLFTTAGERVYLDATADLVHLGARSGTAFVALATTTESRLSALESWAKNHIHVCGTGPGNTSATAVTLNVPAQPVAATKVKAT